MAKSSNGNVKMIITEEKILANIDKIRKMINPNSKKQIVQLEQDSYFLDLIASIKSYLGEYPKEEPFPRDVYDAAYDLVDYATTQFEDNTKKIEELIRQRENNISLSTELKDVLAAVDQKVPNWKKMVQDISGKISEDVVDSLGVMGRAKSKKTQTYLDSLNLVNTKISNLESNLYIEVDMERIEDRSKALSYIGIEIAESLKDIQNIEEAKNTETAKNINTNSEADTCTNTQTNVDDISDTQSEDIETEEPTETYDLVPYKEEVVTKPSLWERIKNMKLIRGIRYLMKIKVVLELPEPEDNKNK